MFQFNENIIIFCRILWYCDYGHFHPLHWKSTKRVKSVITACCWWILQPAGKIKQHLPWLLCAGDVSQCSKSSFIINYSCSPPLAPAPSRRRRAVPPYIHRRLSQHLLFEICVTENSKFNAGFYYGIISSGIIFMHLWLGIYNEWNGFWWQKHERKVQTFSV